MNKKKELAKAYKDWEKQDPEGYNSFRKWTNRELKKQKCIDKHGLYVPKSMLKTGLFKDRVSIEDMENTSAPGPPAEAPDPLFDTIFFDDNA